MNFNFKNISKDAAITSLGLLLSLVLVLVSLLLLWKGKANFEQVGSFLGAVLPIVITLFSLAGREKQ